MDIQIKKQPGIIYNVISKFIFRLIYGLIFSAVISQPVLAEHDDNDQINSSTEIKANNLRRSHFSHAAKYAQLGYNAAVNGQWHIARDGWEKAVEHLELSDASVRNRAVFYYEFGHAAGITCDFDIAEEFIEKSYQLEKSINGPYVLSLVEMFRLYFDQKQFKLASIYFEAALPKLTLLNAAENTPMRYSRLLDEYADSLLQLDKNQLAQQYKLQSRTIRQKFDNPQQQDSRTRYGSSCSDNRKNYPMTIAQSSFVSSRMSKIREILKTMNTIKR